MIPSKYGSTLMMALGCLVAFACQPQDKSQSSPPKESVLEEEALWSQANQLFKALKTIPDSPSNNPTTPEKVELGRMLFHEPRLSQSGRISCSSCHNLALYGVDGRPTSLGHNAQVGSRNAPTVFNASLHFSQFWDGRAADLESQAAGPILNPVEMAMESEPIAVERLQKIPEYQAAFQKVFPESSQAISYTNITRAIAAFERTLLTPSPFDEYLAGNRNRLSAAEKEGLQTYIRYGCTACHNGMGLGGNLYQKFGLIHPYPHEKDTGRFQVTQKPEDKYVFKVPSLRNVARTAPYFHDGQVSDLQEAILIMAKTQLGKNMPPEDAQKIAVFLNSLTGEIPNTAHANP